VIYLWRYSLVALYTVFWGSLGIVLFVLDRSGRAAPWVVRNWTSWIVRSCGVKVVAEGAGAVADAQPCVIMSNHQSVFDIAALATTLPVPWKFVAKRELIWIPFFGWALGLADQIIIDRRNNERSVASLARAATRVREGANVIIFPEGTRSASAELGPFKSGGFHLAIQAGVPIQPVSISGSRHITPRNSLRIERGEILLRYGKPIPTAGLSVDDREALKQRVREAIESGIDPARQV
jgi:1-acyl-sn-glycerol-3-phosphate acyltransferase